MLKDSPVAAVIPCVDLEAARNFYGGVLGLKPVDMPGDTTEGAAYECGQGTRLFIYRRDTPTKADHTVADWTVADIDKVVDELLAHGVEIKTYDMPGVEWDDRGVATMNGMRGIWFEDPAGNILAASEFVM